MILAPDDLLPQGPARWAKEAVGEAWATCRRGLKAALLDPEILEVVILVGIPGSGKSAWTLDHDEPHRAIFDACWAEPGRRRAVAQQIRQAGKVAIAVWIRTPLDVCRERNALRPPDRRVPDVALARAWVSLSQYPPTLYEGWHRVLVQDGQAERIHDAALTHEQKLERAAQAPAKLAWKILRAKVLPALAKAEPGAGVPPEVEEHLQAMEKILAKGSAKTTADIAKIGGLIEARERAAWDKVVTKAIGTAWETPPAENLIAGWSERNAAKVNGIAAGIVPGLRASIAEAVGQGKTAAEIEKAWSEGGLPLAGFGTAEGRARVLAKGSAAEIASDATRKAQEALDCDQYEWGPTTSKSPDPAHAALRGKRFRWSEPPPGGHPGTRHGCHCKAKPVITISEAKDIKAAIAPEIEPEPKPKPTPTPKKPAKPKAKPGEWKPLPVPDLPKPATPKAAPPPPPVPAPEPELVPEPPKAPVAPKRKPKATGAVPEPASWSVARAMEAKALAGLSGPQQARLRELIEQDQPVHNPRGPVVGAKGSSKAAAQWGKTLTDDQRDAIEDWSEDGFSRMRAVDGGILGGRPEKFLNMSGDQYIKTRRQLADLRTAMRSPDAPKHEGTLYRGLTLPLGVPDAAAYFKDLTTEGHEFQLESLSSWSHNKGVSKNEFSADTPGGLLVKITKSTRGVPINAKGLSSFGTKEGEVLLDKGSRYRVVRITREKGDQHRQVVELEEI